MMFVKDFDHASLQLSIYSTDLNAISSCTELTCQPVEILFFVSNTYIHISENRRLLLSISYFNNATYETKTVT